MRLLWLWPLCALVLPSVSVRIVLTHCNESLTWLDEFGYGPITTVYDKCGNSEGPGQHVPAPNLGRESGTYLQHIVDHYDSLDDWTIFSQAEAPSYGYRGHRRGGGHLMHNTRFQDYVDAAATRQQHPRFFVFTSIVQMEEGNVYQCVRRGYDQTPTKAVAPSDFEEKVCGLAEEWEQWYEFPIWFSAMVADLQQEQNAPLAGVERDAIFRLFDVEAEEGMVFFAQGARFALSREAIRSRPKAYYQRLLPYLQHPDPWAGYFLEWLWWYVMGGDPAPCGFEPQVADDFRGWVQQDASRRAVAQAVSGAVDCTWGDWGSWTCSVTCGGGTSTRTRSKTVTESGGGTCTGSSTDTNSTACNTLNCSAAVQEKSCSLVETILGGDTSSLSGSDLSTLNSAATADNTCTTTYSDGTRTTYFTTPSQTTDTSFRYSESLMYTVTSWGASTVWAVVTINVLDLTVIGVPAPSGFQNAAVAFACTFERSNGNTDAATAFLANSLPLIFQVTVTNVLAVFNYNNAYPDGKDLLSLGGTITTYSTYTEIFTPNTSTLVGFANTTNSTNGTSTGGGSGGGSNTALYGLLALLVIPLLLCCLLVFFLWRRRKASEEDDLEYNREEPREGDPAVTPADTPVPAAPSVVQPYPYVRREPGDSAYAYYEDGPDYAYYEDDEGPRASRRATVAYPAYPEYGVGESRRTDAAYTDAAYGESDAGAYMDEGFVEVTPRGSEEDFPVKGAGGTHPTPAGYRTSAYQSADPDFDELTPRSSELDDYPQKGGGHVG